MRNRRVPVRQPTAAIGPPFSLPSRGLGWRGSVVLQEVFGVALDMAEVGVFGKLAAGSSEWVDMTSSFPRLFAAWLGVRVANRKKVRWQSIATHESGGLSPFRGHRSTLNAWRNIIIAGGLVNSSDPYRELHVTPAGNAPRMTRPPSHDCGCSTTRSRDANARRTCDNSAFADKGDEPWMSDRPLSPSTMLPSRRFRRSSRNARRRCGTTQPMASLHFGELRTTRFSIRIVTYSRIKRRLRHGRGIATRRKFLAAFPWRRTVHPRRMNLTLATNFSNTATIAMA